MQNTAPHDARGWFHAAAWLGLAATAYTNLQAAPTADLRVGYLAVPVLLAFVSEGLIRKWPALPAVTRALLSTLAFALVCVSYEHFVHMILAAGGTWFAAWVGGAVIDLTIFGCVLATCVLSRGVAPGVAPSLSVVAERDTATVAATIDRDTATPVDDVCATPRHLERDTATPELPSATPERDTATPTATPERDTATPNDSDTATLRHLRDAYGDTRPGVREVMRTLQCGDRRAKRLILLEYGET